MPTPRSGCTAGMPPVGDPSKPKCQISEHVCRLLLRARGGNGQSIPSREELHLYRKAPVSVPCAICGASPWRSTSSQVLQLATTPGRPQTVSDQRERRLELTLAAAVPSPSAGLVGPLIDLGAARAADSLPRRMACRCGTAVSVGSACGVQDWDSLHAPEARACPGRERAYVIGHPWH
jgi:hypothetical protein